MKKAFASSICIFLLICTLSISCIGNISGEPEPQSNEAITIYGYEGNYSKPVFSDGAIFISTPKNFVVINATNGQGIWAFGDTSGEINSTPVIVNGFCYFTTANGWLIVLNTKNWSMPCELSCGNSSVQIFTLQLDDFPANPVTLEVTFNLDAKEAYSPLTIGNMTYIVSNDGRATAIDEYNNTVWTRNISGLPVRIDLKGYVGNYSKPLIVDGIIYISSQIRVYTLNATNGFELWSSASGYAPEGGKFGSVYSVPVVLGDTCYFATESTTQSYWLFAINVTTGVASHFCNFTADDKTIFFEIKADGTHIYVDVNLSEKVEYSPTTANGITYSISQDITVLATNSSDSSQIWSKNIKGLNYVVPVGSTIYEKQAQNPMPTATAIPIAVATPEPTITIAITPSPTPNKIEANNNVAPAFGTEAILDTISNNISAILICAVLSAIVLSAAIVIKLNKKRVSKHL